MLRTRLLGVQQSAPTREGSDFPPVPCTSWISWISARKPLEDVTLRVLTHGVARTIKAFRLALLFPGGVGPGLAETWVS